MVRNWSSVLDEGVLKSMPETKVNMKYDQKLLDRWKHEASVHYFSLEKNPELRENTWLDNMCHKYNFPVEVKPRYRAKLYEEIQKHFNYIPFIPFITFNISPNWASCEIDGTPLPWKVAILENSIKDFFRISKRFTQIDYAIEGGSDNKHLHAHVVARINPDQQATVITQLQKGNLSNGYRKIWIKNLQKPYIKKGMGGIMKGKFAIQSSLMRKEEFLIDKLNYLKEDLKPEDHKNLVDLNKRETIYF